MLTDAAGPIGWTATEPGVWTKPLLAAADGGDGFAMWRLAPGATATLDATPEDRFLVLTGPVHAGEPESVRHHRGDYFTVPADRPLSLGAPDGALLFRLTGPNLGPSTRDAFGPDGWFAAGPGQWARLLLQVDLGGDFDERIVGVSHMEPGSSSALHPHPTPHRFLYVEGSADDEIVWPDGRRETARRRAGQFVDYPAGVQHRTFSGDGCTLVFVHEALPGPTANG